MASQVKLTLRPPPNVDFVHGYPGIPPGQDRPQAAVKGAIEVRVPTQGVKAKWVRIELRKVEVLPGGGQANTFYDFVGPSPVNLWTSSDEYSILKTQDFPFSIRIPESIPPSIVLDNRAGISYELVASVCIKGKKGFLRKAKSIVASSQSSIIIDKHDLHSTWPVYCQPEERSTTLEGITLTTSRSNNCYGPGDRITVLATLKSDSVHAVILRGFEMTLKESTVFRASPYGVGGVGGGGGFGGGKKAGAAPQVKLNTISESKFVVNATIFGGQQHKAELTCGLSPNHTTTTLNSARHIDVTYTLTVKALMGPGPPVVLDLPVVISNWQKHVSIEAIRRIGPAPSLSLLPPNAHPSGHTPSATPTNHTFTRTDPGRAGLTSNNAPSSMIGSLERHNLPLTNTTTTSTSTPTLLGGGGGGGNRASVDPPSELGLGYNYAQAASAYSYSSVPVKSSGLKNGVGADEFGYGVGVGGKVNAATTGGIGLGGRSMSANASSTLNGTGAGGGGGGGGATGRRPRSANANGGTNRFTITNLAGSEMSDMGHGGGGGGGDSGGGERGGGGGVGGERGERERGERGERERGERGERERGEREGGGGKSWMPADEEKLRYEKAKAQVEKKQGAVTGIGATSPPTTPPPGSKWPTAEEEKNRYHAAEAARAKAQAQGVQPITTTTNTNTTDPTPLPIDVKVKPANTAAELYAQAMAARNNTIGAPKQQGGIPKVPQYLTAEQEKAALRRYEEAKRAVDRTQYGSDDGHAGVGIGSGGGLVDYDSLYPNANGGDTAGGGSSSQKPATAYQPPPPPPAAQQHDLPPPFENTSGIPAAHLSEKERMRRAYEAKDAAAVLARNNPNPNDSVYTPPGYGYAPPPAAAGYAQYGAAPPPAPAGYTASPPPFSSAPQQYPNALAEKEALRRKFEAQDAAAAAAAAVEPPARVGSVPPPLMINNASSPTRTSNRPAPVPPAATTSKVLTAAEEKALLKARYDAEDAGNKPRVNGNGNGNARSGSSTAPPSPSSNAPPAPPPLMPRPPAEYIQETQEEDARVSRFATSEESPTLDDDVEPPLATAATAGSSIGSIRRRVNGNESGTTLDMQPFTPFTPGFEIPKTPGPPPPLPPKLPLAE